MNWVGGARNRIKKNQEKKKMEEFFAKKRAEKRLKEASGGKPATKMSQDLIFLQTISNLCDRNVESPYGEEVKIRKVDMSPKKRQFKLPMSPITENSKLDLEGEEKKPNPNNYATFKDVASKIRKMQKVQTVSQQPQQPNRKHEFLTQTHMTCNTKKNSPDLTLYSTPPFASIKNQFARSSPHILYTKNSLPNFQPSNPSNTQPISKNYSLDQLCTNTQNGDFNHFQVQKPFNSPFDLPSSSEDFQSLQFLCPKIPEPKTRNDKENRFYSQNNSSQAISPIQNFPTWSEKLETAQSPQFLHPKLPETKKRNDKENCFYSQYISSLVNSPAQPFQSSSEKFRNTQSPQFLYSKVPESKIRNDKENGFYSRYNSSHAISPTQPFPSATEKFQIAQSPQFLHPKLPEPKTLNFLHDSPGIENTQNKPSPQLIFYTPPFKITHRPKKSPYFDENRPECLVKRKSQEQQIATDDVVILHKEKNTLEVDEEPIKIFCEDKAVQVSIETVQEVDKVVDDVITIKSRSLIDVSVQTSPMTCASCKLQF